MEKLNLEINNIDYLNNGKKEYEYVHDFEWNEEFEKEAKKIIEENPDTIELDELIDMQNKNWEKIL